MDNLLGHRIRLQVDTELNDHETIRLMVQQGVGASILPHSWFTGECALNWRKRTALLRMAAYSGHWLSVLRPTGHFLGAREAVAEIVTSRCGHRGGGCSLPP
jgi:DNA-binding transcriptional LysR family regulator